VPARVLASVRGKPFVAWWANEGQVLYFLSHVRSTTVSDPLFNDRLELMAV